MLTACCATIRLPLRGRPAAASNATVKKLSFSYWKAGNVLKVSDLAFYLLRALIHSLRDDSQTMSMLLNNKYTRFLRGSPDLVCYCAANEPQYIIQCIDKTTSMSVKSNVDQLLANMQFAYWVGTKNWERNTKAAAARQLAHASACATTPVAQEATQLPGVFDLLLPYVRLKTKCRQSTVGSTA
jgi:hypothetical protein